MCFSLPLLLTFPFSGSLDALFSLTGIYFSSNLFVRWISKLRHFQILNLVFFNLPLSTLVLWNALKTFPNSLWPWALMYSPHCEVHLSNDRHGASWESIPQVIISLLRNRTSHSPWIVRVNYIFLLPQILYLPKLWLLGVSSVKIINPDKVECAKCSLKFYKLVAVFLKKSFLKVYLFERQRYMEVERENERQREICSMLCLSPPVISTAGSRWCWSQMPRYGSVSAERAETQALGPSFTVFLATER